MSTSLTAKIRRLARVRAKVRGTADRPRLAVHRSLRHISSQIIDDATGRTLVAAKDTELPEDARKGKTKTEVAKALGVFVGERAKAKGITSVVFDRRDKRYHGRVQAVAEGARSAGLIF